MAVGGSVESVSINGRVFAVAADADGSRKVGGFENEVQANGDGTARNVKTRVTWMFDGLSLVVNDDRGDQEFLQGVADGTESGADADGFYSVAFTLASGTTWSGNGTITGEVTMSTQNVTAGITFGGPGRLTAQ